MSLRRHFCVALAFLDLHRPDCEHCAVQDCMGVAMRRLRDLNEHAQRMYQEKSQAEGEKKGSDAA